MATCGAAVLLTACSSSQSGDVSITAQKFYSAVADLDGPTACALLSPDARTELEQSAGKACAEGVLEEALPESTRHERARVYGTMAIVRAGDDTMFLSRFPTGWLITAVGCQLTERAERYDCTVAGS
jgi:hypothetical protein